MDTNKQLEATAHRLHDELAEVERGIKANREALTQAANTPTDPAQSKQAEQIAARIMVLDARAQALQDAIKRNQAETQRRAEVVKTKEYKDAQKKIAELQKHFLIEADGVHNEFVLLCERITAALEKHGEFTSLINRYCVDLDPYERGALKDSKDVSYLIHMQRFLHAEQDREKQVIASQQMTKEMIDRRPEAAAQRAERETWLKAEAKRRPFVA